MELSLRHLNFAALGGATFCLILAILSGNLLVSVFSLILFGFSLVVLQWGEWIFPPLLARFGLVVSRGPHRVLSDAVVLPCDGRFLASSFLRVDVRESPTLSSTESSSSYAAAFEKMICSLRFPVKYSVLVYALDTETYREGILVKRLEAEMALGRLKKEPKPNALAVAREERKLSMHARTLDRLASGEKPLDAEYVVMTTAQGASESEAVEKALVQARQLKAVVSNALGAHVTLMSGRGLLNCLDWEFVLPPTYESFKDAV